MLYSLLLALPLMPPSPCGTSTKPACCCSPRPGVPQVNWWRAQGVRFLLRWPSAYLCHILNFARHQAYGRAVAEAVLRGRGQGGQQQGKGQGGRRRLVAGAETGELMGPIDLPLGHCNAKGQLCTVQGSDSGPGSGSEGAPIDPLPFIPRPIVRVHVRGSDKGREMQLLGVSTYFEAMGRLRHTSGVPFRNVWLSSEEQVLY